MLARGNEHDVEAVGDSAMLVTFDWTDWAPRPDLAHQHRRSGLQPGPRRGGTRVSLTNHGDGARHISLTSYAELVLGSADSDAAHPAFSKLPATTSSEPLVETKGGGCCGS